MLKWIISYCHWHCTISVIAIIAYETILRVSTLLHITVWMILLNKCQIMLLPWSKFSSCIHLRVKSKALTVAYQTYVIAIYILGPSSIPGWLLCHFSLSYLVLFFIVLLTRYNLSVEMFIWNINSVEAGTFLHILSAQKVPGLQYWMLSLFGLNFYSCIPFDHIHCYTLGSFPLCSWVHILAIARMMF